jgi:hypothetical protein
MFTMNHDDKERRRESRLEKLVYGVMIEEN